MKMDQNVMVNGGGGSSADMWSRGTKRGASDSNLSDFDRFEKRLRMLSIRGSEQNRKGKSKQLYPPISHAPTEAAATPNDVSNGNHAPQDELMQVDDTRDRIYIHDLDAELEDDKSDEDKLIFLPDIEKRFTRIPQQVLTGRGNDSQELVLYDIPKSLTVDEDHDSVRKAIIEARHRAREKAVEEARQDDMNRTYGHSNDVASAETAHGYNSGYEQEQQEEQDPDAMDID